MKLDSKYFDAVRTKPSQETVTQATGPVCQWRGCQATGSHRAPMGRGREGKYYLFCLDHVRQFNASYNYFEGWSTADVEAYQKDSIIGHRPTWRTATSVGGGSVEGQYGFRSGLGRGHADPHGFFASGEARKSAEPQRRLRPLEIKALEALDLTERDADKIHIKARFKELVKRHHPDANGGDKRSENKLREIIQAYNYLKQAGLV
jgi:curved DNA-binding protein CbpA